MGQSLAPKPTPANNGNINTLSTFIGGLQSNIYFRPPRSFNNWVQQDSGGMFWFDSANTKTMWYHNGTSRVQIGAGGGGSGTVTNVSTGFGMLGGPITTTGTVRVDSNYVMTLARGYKVSDSVASVSVPYVGATQTLNLGTQNIITDTITGTGSGGLHLHGSSSNSGIEIANFGQVRMDYYPIANSGDSVLTTNSNGYIQVYNLKGNYQKLSDTSTWDATKAYVNALVIDTTALSNRINQKQNFSDTSTYDATQAWVNSRGFGTGTVTSVGSGFGLTGGAITTSGTLRIDTANVPTQYRVDTTAANALARINTKGSGTVTSIQVVGGTGATVTPTTAVTTSGVYTVTPDVSSATYNTLSNKRWVPRVISAASYTTSVTIPADSVDLFQITAQAGSLLFNAPSGTPNNGDLLVIRIKDNGTARALTYNAIFNWSPPSTTVLGKYLVMCFMYNSVTSNWNFMWKRDEP